MFNCADEAVDELAGDSLGLRCWGERLMMMIRVSGRSDLLILRPLTPLSQLLVTCHHTWTNNNTRAPRVKYHLSWIDDWWNVWRFTDDIYCNCIVNDFNNYYFVLSTNKCFSWFIYYPASSSVYWEHFQIILINSDWLRTITVFAENSDYSCLLQKL